jgi:hypothetical protein
MWKMRLHAHGRRLILKLTTRFFALCASLIMLVDSAPTQAQSLGGIGVTAQDPKSGTSFPAQQKWSWLKNDESVFVLSSIVTVQLPDGFSADSVRTSVDGNKGKARGNKLALRMISMSDNSIVSGGGSQQAVAVHLRVPASTIVDDGCAALLLRLRIKTPSDFPFYLGVKCTGDLDHETTLSLTFPSEVTLAKSSIFETRGKGESWRYYELGNLKAAAGQFAQFTFRYGDKNYEFALDSLRNAKGKDPDDQVKLSLGPNYTLMTVVGQGVSSGNGEPGLTLRIPSFSLFGHVRSGLTVETTLPLTSSASSISYTQLQAFLGYGLIGYPGGTFRFEPRLYLVVANSQDQASGLGFNMSNLGGGLWVSYGKTWQTSLEAFMASFGSKTVSSHFCADFGLLKKAQDEKSLSYGGGIKIQSYTAMDKLGGSDKFGQTLLYSTFQF